MFQLKGYRYFGLTQEVQKWSLTYPKCPLTPEEALARLQALPLSATIKHYLICSEPHQDGDLHLHCYLNFDKKVSFSATRFDLDEYHGNYQPTSSPKAWVAYCTKGANYISNFDVHALANKKASGRALNKRLLEEDLTELVREGDIPLEKYLKLKANKEAFFRDVAPPLPFCVGFIPNSLGKIFPVYSSAVKLRHYWIWSRNPNSGKTTFLKSVASSYPSYWMCYKENFQSLHPRTQFILLDEYSSPHLTTTQLNQMCDGTWMYPVKGGTAIMLAEPIILVAANKPIDEVYPNDHLLIKARFSQIDL